MSGEAIHEVMSSTDGEFTQQSGRGRAKRAASVGGEVTPTEGPQSQLNVCRVARTTNPNKLAAALLSELENHGQAEAQAIGPGAVNQAVKAGIILRGMAAKQGKDARITPMFTTVDEGEQRTAIRFLVQLADA